MQELSDAQLLQSYAQSGQEHAFREIVVRHTDLVYSAALRQVASPDIAHDVTQNVFSDLARKAAFLSAKMAINSSLAGWLYRSTRFEVLNRLRDDRRRREHERQAMEQLVINSAPEQDWERLRPILDDAMADLSDEEREALLLRYFKNHDFITVGKALGVSDDTAQKRVSRAVDHLRELFSKRNVTIGAAGLCAVISTNAVHAAPIGLVLSLSTTALSGTTIATTSTLAATTKIIAMTTLQKAIITVTLTAAIGAGIFEAHKNTESQKRVETLLQQQQTMVDEIQSLRQSRDDASNQFTALREDILARAGQTTPAARSAVAAPSKNAREIAVLKAALAEKSGSMPDFLTNAMAAGMGTASKFMRKDAMDKIARMQQALNLSDGQALSISNVMSAHIDRRSQMTLDLMMGKLTPEQRAAQGKDSANEEAEIKALLSSSQIAAYPDYLQAERSASAEHLAQSDASQLATSFKLSGEQKELMHVAFYQLNMEDKTADREQAMTAAKQNGNLGEVGNIAVEMQKTRLEEKLKVLGDFLSPDQLNTYREEQLAQINLQAQAMKMFERVTN